MEDAIPALFSAGNARGPFGSPIDTPVRARENAVPMDPILFITLDANALDAAGEQIHVWQLIRDASPVVMLVMLILALMSLGCWFIIGAKLRRLGEATRTSERFLERFWAGEANTPWDAQRLQGIYAELGGFKNSPVSAIFRRGYVELVRSTEGGGSEGGIENVERALRRAKQSELTELENYVPFLATTGSTAPFVGLFGTVWGIMNSFIQLRNSTEAATIDAVAPASPKRSSPRPSASWPPSPPSWPTTISCAAFRSSRAKWTPLRATTSTWSGATF
jgi:biopolymer transport protein TolQ